MKIKLFIVASLVLVVGGCTINQQHLASAIEACKDHEGIYTIRVDSPFVDVTCKDGTYIDNIKGK